MPHKNQPADACQRPADVEYFADRNAAVVLIPRQGGKGHDAAANDIQLASSDPIEFFKRLRPAGLWVFTTIVPDGRVITRSFGRKDERKARDFVAQQNVTANVYYTVNSVKQAVNKKPSKDDIDCVEYLHVDADPDKDETPEQFKARFLPKVAQFKYQPTFVIDSGNGIHLLWRLNEPVKLTSKAEIADIEARNYWLAQQFGADPCTRNVDRILRMPGTTNHPNAKKLKDGRTAVPSTLIEFNDVSIPLDAIPSHREEKSRAQGKDRGADRDKKTRFPADVGALLHLTNEAGYASRSELLFCLPDPRYQSRGRRRINRASVP